MLTGSVVSGYVYHDVTGDGRYGSGDRPIAGSPVQLVNAAKVVVGSTTTDASGRYEFSTDATAQAAPQSSSSSASEPGKIHVANHDLPQNRLKPGRYTVVQTRQPDGFLHGSNTRDGVAVPQGAGVDTIPVVLGAKAVTDNDFGEVRPSSLSGSVYLDANNNGARDAKEFGIATVRVTLRGKDESRHAVILATETDDNGVYQLNNLRPGQYTITAAQPRPFRSGQESVGSAGGQGSRNRFSRVVLRADTQGVNYNFGEQTRPDCSLAVNLSRVDRGMPLRGNLGPSVQRFLPGLVTYKAQHPRRRG